MLPVGKLAQWYHHRDQELYRRETRWMLRWLRRPPGVLSLIAYGGLVLAAGFFADRYVIGDPQFGLSWRAIFGLLAGMLLIGLWIHIFRWRTLGPLQKDRLPDLLSSSVAPRVLWPGLLGAPIVFLGSFTLLAAIIPLVGRLLPDYRAAAPGWMSSGYGLVQARIANPWFAWFNLAGPGLLRLGYLAHHFVVGMAVTAYTAQFVLVRKRAVPAAGAVRLFLGGLRGWLWIYVPLALIILALIQFGMYLAALSGGRMPTSGLLLAASNATYGFPLLLITLVFSISVPAWRKSVGRLRSPQTRENLRAYAEGSAPQRVPHGVNSAIPGAGVEKRSAAGDLTLKIPWKIGAAATLILAVFLWIEESAQWLLLGAPPEINSATPLPAPRATITVDGKVTDWVGVPEVAMNAPGGGPWNPTRFGIQNIKLAHDDRNLYVLFQLGMGIQETLDRLDKDGLPARFNPFSFMFRGDASMYKVGFTADVAQARAPTYWGRWSVQPRVAWALWPVHPDQLSGWIRREGGRSWERRNDEGRIVSIQGPSPPWVLAPGRAVAWSNGTNVASDGPFLELKFPMNELGTNPETPIRIALYESR